MATDKRFVVKNGLQTENINFVFNDAVVGSSNITATMLSSNTLSFSGTTGQLFSIADSMTGLIFAVNDISGVPSIEVYDDGRVRMAEGFGNVIIGNSTINTSRTSISTTTGILQVAGGAGIVGNVNTGGQLNVFSGNINIFGSNASTSSTTGALITGNGVGIGGNLNVGGTFNLFTNRVGIGTTAPAGVSNALVVYGSIMAYGNLDLANPTGGTSGIYFNDGSYQTTAFTGATTPSYGPAGTVQIAGAGNTFSGDSGSFFYDTANKRLGIGTGSPGNTLTVWGLTPAWFNTTNGSNIYEVLVGNATTTAATVGYASTPLNPYGYIKNAGGTTALSMLNSGNVGIKSITNPVNTLDVGGSLAIGIGYAGVYSVTPNNSLGVQGSIGVGTTAPLSTVDVRGGFSATGAASVGGTATVNALVSNGAITGTVATFTSLQNSGTETVNALVSNVYGLFGQNVTINSTNSSTSTTTGALILAGGAGIAGNVYVGGNVVAGTFQPTSANVPGAGIYLPSTNIIGFAAASVETMRIDNNGNVGIGTSGPTARLHLNAATGNYNGIRFSAVGWPYFGRLGMNGTSGGDQYWSTNWNAVAGTVDNSTYATSYVNINTNGVVAFGNGATNTVPTEKMRITTGGVALVGGITANTIEDGAGNTFTPLIQSNVGTGTAGIAVSVMDGTNNHRAGLFVDNTNLVWGLSDRYSTNAFAFVIRNNSGERMRIDSLGRLLLGDTTARSYSLPDFATNYLPSAQITGTSYNTAWLSISQWSTSTTTSGGGYLSFNKSNNATIGTHTVVNSNQRLGGIGWAGSDGSTFIGAASIYGETDAAAVSTGSISGRLIFSTSASAAVPVERMRIDQYGNVSMGTTTVGQAAAGRTSLTINGSTDSLISLLGGGTNRGYIWGAPAAMYLTSSNALYLDANNTNPTVFRISGTERMRIDSAGLVGIGTNIPGSTLDVNGVVSARTAFSTAGTANVNALTSNTGITVSAGGITVTGASQFTGNVAITGNLIVTGAVNTQSANVLVINDPLIYIGDNNQANLWDLGIVASYNSGTYYHTGFARNRNDGAWTVFDTLTTEPNASIGNINWGDSTITFGPMKVGNLTIMGNTRSTSSTTGALVMNGLGGIGIGGNLYVGGQQSGISGNLWISGSNSSTSSTTGALVLGGGIGLIGNVYAGGNVVAASFQPTSASIPDSGLYLPAVSTLAMSTAGLERLRVDANGNLGVGMVPISRLDVSGGDIRLATNATYIRSVTTGGTSVRMLGINASNVAYVGPIDSGPLATIFNASSTSNIAAFYTGATERLRIDGTGNVGIGSAMSVAGSAFVRDLTVNAAIQTAGTLTVNALVSNVYGRFGQNVTINSSNASTSGTTGALVVAGGVGIGGNINVTGSDSEFTGKVGIGTTTTGANAAIVYNSLDVSGNIDLNSISGRSSGIYFADGTYQTTAITNQLMSTYEYTGDGATTVFSTSPSVANGTTNTMVFINGVYQLKNVYSWSGTSLTFTSPPPQYSLVSINVIGSVAAAGTTSIIGYQSVSGNTALSPTAPFAIVSGNVTVTLPSASTSAGQMFYVKNIGNGNVTVSTINSETIDGNSSLLITSKWATAGLLSNGSNWFIF